MGGNKSSRQVIKKRRNKVKELFFVRKYTLYEISETLKYNVSTIWRDIEAIRESVDKKIKEIKASDILVSQILQKNTLIQRLWREYDNADTAGARNMIINSIDKIEESLLETLKRFGILRDVAEKAPDTVIDVKAIIGVIQKYEEDEKFKPKFIKRRRKDN